MNRRPAIETTRLSIGYQLKGGKRKIGHDDLSLSLCPGKVTCLLGLNGAGKSTLLRTLCGFQPPLGGEIRLLGKPLSEYSENSFSLTVGVVLTEKTNTGGISVYDLVSLGRHPYTGFFGQLKQHDHAIIRESLAAAGIEHKACNYVSELSDGERQKAMIAKTLAQQCPVILLDVPTAFLDVTSRIETMLLLRRLAREQHKTILLSTHDMEQALQLADRLWLLAKDRRLASGTPEDLVLSGTFGSFFEKEGIRFDLQNGRLNAETEAEPLGISGDPLLVRWVSNALIRNGYRPVSPEKCTITIRCEAPDVFLLDSPDGKNRAKDIESLLQLIKNQT